MSAPRPKRCRETYGGCRCTRHRYHKGRHWGAWEHASALDYRVEWEEVVVTRKTIRTRKVRTTVEGDTR